MDVTGLAQVRYRGTDVTGVSSGKTDGELAVHGACGAEARNERGSARSAGVRTRRLGI
jgi:hypothetical protein